MSSAMKGKSLEAIDISLIEAGDFLKGFEEGKAKLSCLQAFAESLDIIEWIRNETKSELLYLCTLTLAV